MSNTATKYKCKCGNDRFQLVSEVQKTMFVDVSLSKNGKLQWEPNSDAGSVEVSDTEAERLIECSTCLTRVPVEDLDGMLSVSYAQLEEVLEAGGDEAIAEKLRQLVYAS